MDTSGRSNGLYVDKNGNILACADEKNELWSIDPEGKIRVLLTGFEGKKFNGPNDLWQDRKGGIYFTDPYYQRDYWERKKPEMERQNVYYLPKNRSEARVVDADLMQPNGIVGSRDGKKLYVADIRANKTYIYQINKDGSSEIARRSRGTPRIAIRLLRRVRDFANASGKTLIDKKMADSSLLRLEVDALGLDSADHRYLKYIAEFYQGGPVGVETIAAGLSEQRDAIEETIEPYLLQVGFIQRTPRGRMLTAGCFKHLGLKAPAQLASLPLLENDE